MKFRSCGLCLLLILGCSESTTGSDCEQQFVPGTNIPLVNALDNCAPEASAVDATILYEDSGAFGTGTIDAESAEESVEDPDVIEEEDALFCQPGTIDCMSATSLGVCSFDGSEFVEQPCPVGFGCLAGSCAPNQCAPGEKKGECASSFEYFACNEGGTQFEPVPCDGGLKCYQGECEDLTCVPNSVICYGTTGYKECDNVGGGYGEAQLCPEGSQCQQDGAFGKCVDACEANVKANVYLGCDYFAVDLDNVGDAANSNVGIVVSVPENQKQATLVVTDRATGQTLDSLVLQVEGGAAGEPVRVDPGDLKTLLLPTDSVNGPNPLDGSVISSASYSISSDVPVTVHQFNPLNGEGVFTNDASLLFPSNLGGQEYLVMSWPHRVVSSEEELRGYVAIIATEEGETSVTVVPRSPLAAGVGVPAIAAGESRTFKLQQGEVLNLESAGETGNDITGTWIQATQRVTAMSGHECANVPLGVNYCDHLEQQIFPLNTWGKTYIGDAYWQRNEKQFDVWRVMGGADDIQVTSVPPIPGYETFTVHKGSIIEFQSPESFKLEATGPILVGHYMIGSNYPGYEAECVGDEEGVKSSGIGDPALSLGVPIEQYLKEYVVLTPPGYEKNYVNVIAPTGAEVTFDGAPIEVAPVSVGETGFEIYRFPVEAGVHTLKGSDEFGLTAYGYDCDVSYAYPGGLKLQALTEN